MFYSQILDGRRFFIKDNIISKPEINIVQKIAGMKLSLDELSIVTFQTYCHRNICARWLENTSQKY